MYPVRVRLLHPGVPEPLDHERLRHELVASPGAPEGGATIAWARSCEASRELQIIVFVTATTAEDSVRHCRLSIVSMTSKRRLLDGWTMTSCSLGLGPAPRRSSDRIEGLS